MPESIRGMLKKQAIMSLPLISFPVQPTSLRIFAKKFLLLLALLDPLRYKDGFMIE
jgi:hypothetical protein